MWQEVQRPGGELFGGREGEKEGGSDGCEGEDHLAARRMGVEAQGQWETLASEERKHCFW